MTRHQTGNLRKKQVFDAIKGYLKEFGYPPTIRDICERVDLKSNSSVCVYLDRLEAEGRIKRRPGRNRAISIVRKKR